MARWDWLVKPEKPYTRRFVGGVVVKALVLFLLLNLVYAVVQPLPTLGRLSVYNSVVPGRERLPYADNPTEVYNLSIGNLEAMFSAHKIDDAPDNDEIRVLFFGDSAVWGWLLEGDETFDACLNRGDYTTQDGRPLQAFNLGYPITNALKDVLLMDYATRYNPDVIVWFMTLEGAYDDDQLVHPVITSNRQHVLDIIERYDLSLPVEMLPDEPNILQRSIVGQRRELADWLRLQFYGLAWAISDYDHANPRFFRAPVENFPPSEGIPNRPQINAENIVDFLALDVIEAGMQQAGDVPVLLVNEPIFIGTGQNSDLRYNDLYPRWAYDAYRDALGTLAEQNEWHYVDLWDFVPADRFTDFPLHYDAEYTCIVAETLAPRILALAN